MSRIEEIDKQIFEHNRAVEGLQKERQEILDAEADGGATEETATEPAEETEGGGEGEGENGEATASEEGVDES